MILVAFYNKKALGVRYLEAALERAGYQVTTIFYKDFNSVRPRPSTRREAELFLQVVREKQPVLVGLSVMSSMYLDTVYQLMDGLVREQIAPLVCGGAYATMFPEKLLERGADFVLRSDGERAICRLAEALRLRSDWRSIPSLCWREGEKSIKMRSGTCSAMWTAMGFPWSTVRAPASLTMTRLCGAIPSRTPAAMR